MSEHGNDNGGPSPRLLAWRRFVIETILCGVLIGSAVMLALNISIEPLAGFGIAALATATLRIVWR